MRASSKAFTLVELLVTIAIIAILAVVVVTTINPMQLLAQSRDGNRISDVHNLYGTISFYKSDQLGSSQFSLGSPSVVYVSLPDPAATTAAGSNCSSLNLPVLPSSYSYHCAGPNYYRKTNGTGWIPVNLSLSSTGSPLNSFPIDPTNTSSSRLYYTYTTNGSQFEFTAAMESAKYKLGGSSDQVSGDGGLLAGVYEKGTQLGLEPLDYGDSSLVGYWSMNEGSGNFAYDASGNNATGTWSGTQAGTSGYYSAGKVGPWAGTFNGSNDYIAVPNASNLNFGTGSFTVSAWVKPNSGLASYYQLIGKKAAYNGNNIGWEIWLDYRTTPNIMELRINDGSATGDLTPNPSANLATALNGAAWVHLVLVVNVGQNVTFYLNGTNEGTQSISTMTGSISNSQPITIGKDASGVASFPGLIDDGRLYNRALSAVEINAMYNAGK
jgi:prepilin-type N-terminal cleavage/methylation domain-containing protein